MLKRTVLPFLLCLCTVFIVQGTEIKLGITKGRGDKFEDEFRKYSQLAEFYKQQGNEPLLIDLHKIIHGKYNALTLYAKLKKYHVVLLTTREEGVAKDTAKTRKTAKEVGRALSMYVKKGGGLIIQVSAVRYAGDQDETFWNACIKPFGIQLLHEGVYDPVNNVSGTVKPKWKMTFSHTTNITKHPVTAGVKGLLLPLKSYNPFPGTPPYRFSKDWKVIVRGEKTAKSYKNNKQNNRFSPKNAGTYKSAPPIVAIRSYGKGRIVAIPINSIYTGMNYKNKFWGNQVEYAGFPGKPSNAILLFANAMKWAAQNSLKNPSFGKAKAVSAPNINYPEKISWDKRQFKSLPEYPVEGIWGLHSNLSDGKGSVRDYATAAKAAGLSFIVFSEPLELLTPEKIKKLKADCKAVSNDKFYACPGVEFTDNVGNRWVHWGERLRWPLKSFKKGKYTYKQWDGKVINHYGKFIISSGLGRSALISYKQLRANKAYPENMWWFWNIIPKAYEDSKLIADNSEQMQFAHQDLRWVYPIVFNRIKSPAKLKKAIKTGICSFKSIEAARKNLNRRGNPFHVAKAAQQYIATGGIKIDFQIINNQMENNWLHTRGAQRARCKFVIESPNGIKSVKVVDAFSGTVRKFSGNNAKKISKEFELVHSRKYPLWLEVTDSKGNTAMSHTERIWCYKQGLFRCGDNLNILGALGMYWHPDRNQMLPLIKMFHNAELVSIQGWDRADADCPMPEGWPMNMVNIEGVGEYPPRSREFTSGSRMKVNLVGHDMQYITMQMDELVENCDNTKRGGPAYSSIARKVKDNEYFSRTDSMYAFRDNTDFFMIWNLCQRREGLKNFKGSFILHEGEFKFKKDIVLNGSVPIKLFNIKYPFEAEKRFNKLVVDDLNRGKISIDIKADKTPRYYSGIVRGGGYLAVMNSPVGYIGIMAPHNQKLSYSFSWPNRLYVGLGQNGEKIKKGQVIKYRYIAAILTDTNDNAKQLQELTKTYNLNGGNKGYALNIKIGKLIDAEIFLSLKSVNNEVKFSAGPAETIIDMPIKVSGIQDNGCAAIYSSIHPWFNFVPTLNGVAMLQESIAKNNDIWIGNIFVADNPAVKMTLVKDGQAEGKKPFLEIHNPTDKLIKTKIYSPKNTPVFGGKSFSITIPAGNSIKHNL